MARTSTTNQYRIINIEPQGEVVIYPVKKSQDGTHTLKGIPVARFHYYDGMPALLLAGGPVLSEALERAERFVINVLNGILVDSNYEPLPQWVREREAAQ